MIAAVPLTVHEVEIRSSGMSRKRISASASESSATPTRPTSSSTSGSSESYPIWVGRSAATDSPVPPSFRRSLYRSFHHSGVPNPEYCLKVQSLSR
jgi:hypothetical protein